MPDHLEELFAGLRADTLPQVRPPGIGAARDTVRRRRATRRVAVAAALVVVAGGTAVVALTGHEQVHPQPVGNEQSAQQAVEQLGGRRVGGLVGADVPVTFREVSAGSYTLGVACAGSGVLSARAALTLNDGSKQDLGGQVVSCAADPHPATMLFRLPDNGLVTVAVEGDSQANGGSAYAVSLAVNKDVSDSDQPSEQSTWNAQRAVDQPSEQSTWNAQRAVDLLSVSTSLTPQRITTEAGSETLVTSMAAGAYSLRLACAGPGMVNFKLEELVTADGRPEMIGDTLVDEAVTCLDVEPERYNGLVTVDIPQDAGYMVTVNPDEAARNKAGLAWVLRPE